MQLGFDQEIQILHVDDDPSITNLTATFLEREDDRLTVETATSADEGLQRISDRPPDCVVSDYNMPGTDGIEFLQAVRKKHPDLPFILFTGKGSEEVASDALTAGATDYIQKQSGTEQYELLANRTANAVGQYRSEKRLSETRREYTTVFENAQNGFLLVDIEDDGFRYQQCNPRATELIGEDRAEITGERPRKALGPENGRKVVGAYRKCIHQREPVEYTVTLDLPMGRVIRDCEATPVSSDSEIEKLVVEFRDVTEQRERQRDLEKIETLFQHAQDALFLIDVSDEFSIERINPAYEDATGVSASEIRGQTPKQLLGEEQGTAVEARYRECIERRGPLQYTEQLQFGSEPSYWETRIAPVVVGETVEYIAGSTRNITEQRERQRDLRVLQQAIDDANVSVTLADPSQPDDPLVYVNNAFEDVTGYPPEEMIGRNCRFLQGEDTDPEKVAALRDAIDNEDPVSVELRNYRKDGTEFWNRLTVTPIYDNDDELVRYLGTQEDVTERKKRERELREERRFIEQAQDRYVEGILQDVTDRRELEREFAQIKTIAESLNDAVYVLDEQGRFTYVNDEFTELTGYTEETILGNTPGLIKDIETVETAERQLGRLLSDEGPDNVTFETTIRPKGGDPVVCEDHMGALPYEGDSFNGSVGVLRDISGRKRRERELRRERDRLDEFASVVSHDLRNPLSVAQGNLELLDSECDTDKIEPIERAHTRMNELIDDLLTLARQGGTVSDTESMILGEIAETAWRTVESPRASLHVETDRTVRGDPGRLQQLLENLYRNAVEHGGPEVAVTVGERDDGFYIEDTGPGIPKDEREQVFEPGYSTATDGTGFGLRIVKQVAEAHEWTVRVTESEAGGARFEVTGVEFADR